MPRDTRNRLHIYYMEKLGQEKHTVVYPKSICGVKTNWRDFNYPMAFDLYNQGVTEVCRVFNVLTPEDISVRYEWCWDTIPHPSFKISTNKSHEEELKEKELIRGTEDYKLYKDLWVVSHIRECTNSVFNEAYRNIRMACSSEYGEEIKENGDWKSYFDLNYLFYNMLGNQETSLKYNGAWLLRDGSYITLDTAHHNRFLQDYLGYKEFDMERYWVKISMGTAHVHNKLTNQQWITLEKLKKKYNLEYEKLGDW